MLAERFGLRRLIAALLAAPEEATPPARSVASAPKIRPPSRLESRRHGLTPAHVIGHRQSADGLVIVDHTDAPDWDAWIDAEPGGNFYAAKPWGTYKARLNWTVRRIAVQDGSGRPLAFVQVQQRCIGPARFVLAQGCPVLTAAGRTRAEAALSALRDHLDLGLFDLFGVNFQEFQDNEAMSALLALGFVPVVSARQHTLELDLTRPIATIEAELDPKWRRKLARARRNADLETRILTGAQERLRAFDVFTEMYAALRNRKGFSTTFDPQAFRDIAATDPRLVILEVRENGSPIMVRIAHRAAARWTDFFAASNERGRATNAAALSVWSSIERAKDEGCPIYDLGGIDPAGDRGVFDFKRGISRRVVQSTPLWLYGRSRLVRSLAAAFLAQR